MKESIGTSQVLLYIMIFVIITFTFITATLLYMKAFKMNSLIAGSLEKYEGFNSYSEKEMTDKLSKIGYSRNVAWNKCGNQGYEKIGEFKACVRYKSAGHNYYRYDIITYIEFGPILGVNFSIPIKSESEKIYNFG